MFYNYTINWVQGLEGARAFQLPYPNSNIILLDKDEEGMMYIKSTDNIGMPTIRSYHFEEIKETPKEYVTREELMNLLKELKDEQTIQSTEQPTKPNRNSGKTVKDNEQSCSTH